MLKLIFSFYFLTTSLSFAGSCCSISGTNNAFMLGDSNFVIRSFYMNQSILADVNERDELKERSSESREGVRSARFSMSHRLSDYWQWSASSAYISKSKKINDNWISDEGLGDLIISSAYEFYPEYSRDQFITKSFIYFGMTLPTAPSLFDSKRKDLLDARGAGHNIYSLGLLSFKNFSKHIFILDFNFSLLSGRNFDNSSLTQKVSTKDSLNYNLNFTYNYNILDFLFIGSSYIRNYVDIKPVSVFSDEKSSLLETLALNIGYDHKDYTFNFVYSDDFILNSSYGTILSKSLTLGLIRRF